MSSLVMTTDDMTTEDSYISGLLAGTGWTSTPIVLLFKEQEPKLLCIFLTSNQLRRYLLLLQHNHKLKMATLKFPSRDNIIDQSSPLIASVSSMIDKIQSHETACMLLDFSRCTFRRDGETIKNHTFILYNPDLFLNEGGKQEFYEVCSMMSYRENKRPLPAWVSLAKSKEKGFTGYFVPLSKAEIDAIPIAQKYYNIYQAKLDMPDEDSLDHASSSEDDEKQQPSASYGKTSADSRFKSKTFRKKSVTSPYSHHK